MRIGFHGGLCCGVKHIHGLGVNPQATAVELEERKVFEYDLDGEDFNTGINFYAPAAPAETYEERLKRYIDYIRSKRPGGVVEICLVNGTWYDQDKAWRPILEGHGFKEVNRFLNSNSGATIVLYHLTMKGGKNV